MVYTGTYVGIAMRVMTQVSRAGGVQGDNQIAKVIPYNRRHEMSISGTSKSHRSLGGCAVAFNVPRGPRALSSLCIVIHM